ncbi:MAG: DUF1016 N-terminal domain-containing protein [Herbiconiux sp.]|nr:DUF1016 N-terminal domain-containing protein [Herbiconiux sp.]
MGSPLLALLAAHPLRATPSRYGCASAPPSPAGAVRAGAAGTPVPRVNSGLIALYWTIGHTLVTETTTKSWGSDVLGRIAGDLRAEFPQMKGFSRTNLKYMRSFATCWAAPFQLANNLLAFCRGGTSQCSSTSSTGRMRGTGTRPRPHSTGGRATCS